MARLKALFTGKKEIDPAILEQMEEVMISSDVGVKTTQSILERLREKLKKNELADTDAVWAALRAEATRILDIGQPEARSASKHKPIVVLMVGVNGVGKTTTIGKLATKWNAEGKKVVLAAGDTFRAAAVQQLEVWGKRVGAEVVKGKEGADPGAVAFEATKKAAEVGADVLLVDTAGRLHTKVNLMDEIKKVKRTIAKAMDGAPHETLARSRRDDRPERAHAGRAVQGGPRAHGPHPDEARWHGQGRRRPRCLRRAEGPRPLHRSRRARRGPARVRRRGLRRGSLRPRR